MLGMVVTDLQGLIIQGWFLVCIVSSFLALHKSSS